MVTVNFLWLKEDIVFSLILVPMNRPDVSGEAFALDFLNKLYGLSAKETVPILHPPL